MRTGVVHTPDVLWLLRCSKRTSRQRPTAATLAAAAAARRQAGAVYAQLGLFIKCILWDARRCFCVQVLAVNWPTSKSTGNSAQLIFGALSQRRLLPFVQVSLKRRPRRSWKSSSSRRSALATLWRAWSALYALTRCAKWCGCFCLYMLPILRWRISVCCAYCSSAVVPCSTCGAQSLSGLWLGALSLSRELSSPAGAALQPRLLPHLPRQAHHPGGALASEARRMYPA